MLGRKHVTTKFSKKCRGVSDPPERDPLIMQRLVDGAKTISTTNLPVPTLVDRIHYHVIIMQ